jgi:tRNA(His) 5'-end guanylyltransferase
VAERRKNIGEVMKDDLGNRMKKQYENRTRISLPRRTYSIIRIDGKAFHTLTKKMKCERPFDYSFMNAMDETAISLCKEIQGAKFAYVQSDEISILLTDFEKITTDAWFDGNIQKITSVSASIATAKFNNIIFEENSSLLAYFDSRVFTIPDHYEVENYFIWRQQDATRNSVQLVAQSLYSHKELYKKNQNELQDMIHARGQNWNDYPIGAKRGRFIQYSDNGWSTIDPPIFTQDREFLRNLIPKI